MPAPRGKNPADSDTVGMAEPLGSVSVNRASHPPSRRFSTEHALASRTRMGWQWRAEWRQAKGVGDPTQPAHACMHVLACCIFGVLLF